MSEVAIEVWKPINSESSLYEVSNFGHVRRLPFTNKSGTIDAGYLLSGSKSSTGYHVVKLKCTDGYKNYVVHRLVAIAFIPNPNNYEVVNHLDGDKLNNNAWNLEWTTLVGNAKHAKETGLLRSPKGVQAG